MTIADVAFLHGRVCTVNAQDQIAEAVAVSGNRIVATGVDSAIETYIGPQTRVVDLRGRSLIPGFIDNHIHLETIARQLDWVDCGVSVNRSIADIVDALRSLRIYAYNGAFASGEEALKRSLEAAN